MSHKDIENGRFTVECVEEDCKEEIDPTDINEEMTVLGWGYAGSKSMRLFLCMNHREMFSEIVNAGR